MSANKHTNPAYISHVHLKGYKSIIDTEVELHPGLNIIIGSNGSGKTNFLEFLHKISSLRFNEISKKFEGTLKFCLKNDKNIYIYSFENKLEFDESKKRHIEKFNANLLSDTLKIKKTIDNDSGHGKLLKPIPILRNFENWIINPILISFGLPDEIESLSQSISLVAQPYGDTPITIDYSFKPSVSSGIKGILEDKFSQDIYSFFFGNYDSNNYKEEVERNLKKFSSIKSFRIMPEPKLVKNLSSYRVDFLNFEFLLNDKWLTWNQLSDGTKRLFYIITEVTLNEGLCLVEEPELGTYPGQYDKILNFLKEQAEEKQIILTTHAPRTLDILEDDELDKIILTRYDRELGTKMRHLNEEEINHAKNKEDGLFLSDLWTWTSFFDEEETVI